MKTDGTKWKGHLLEAALSGSPEDALQKHLLTCVGCAQELQHLLARRESMDALLPLIARGAQPQEQFAQRVVNAARVANAPRRSNGRRIRDLFTVSAVLAVGVAIGIRMHRPAPSVNPATEFAVAQNLAQWSAPTDVLLRAPGPDILHSGPALGQTYLKIDLPQGELQ